MLRANPNQSRGPICPNRFSCAAPVMLRRVKRPSIAIVGPGRLGTALAISLRRSGYNIREVIARQGSKSHASAKKLAREVGSLASVPTAAVLDADLVGFCVPASLIVLASVE